MYQRHKKKYTTKSSFAISSTEQSIYDLFNSIRFHSLNVHDFGHNLLETSKDLNLQPEQLTFQGSSLLFYAALYDNETVFNHLTENYLPLFKNDLLKSILYVYSHRNPNILETALNHIQLNPEEQADLFSRFSQNCYRQENITVIQHWLQKHFHNDELTSSELNNFITNLIHFKNRPFLTEICRDTFWKELVTQALPIHAQFITEAQMCDFYTNIIQPEHTYQQPSHSFEAVDYDLRHFMSEKTNSRNENRIESLSKDTKPSSSTTDSTSTSSFVENNMRKDIPFSISKKTSDTPSSHQPVVTVKRKILKN